MNAETQAQITATLRELDPDRYFATLVLPDAIRAPVTALFAFSAEIAAISARVRDPVAGEVRLQWWRDALTGSGHGEVRQNPIADGLLSVIEAHSLPTAPLIGLVEARQFDLYNDPMPDVAAFEGYAGATTSVLYQLSAILGHGGPIDAADAAGHLGVAQALAGHLRAFGYNAARGRIFLPWSIFAANGVAEADVLAGRSGEALTTALQQIRDLAAEHLITAEAAIRILPPTIRPIFGAAALVPAQLRRLARSAAYPFVPAPELADWQKMGLLAWRGWRSR